MRGREKFLQRGVMHAVGADEQAVPRLLLRREVEHEVAVEVEGFAAEHRFQFEARIRFERFPQPMVRMHRLGLGEFLFEGITHDSRPHGTEQIFDGLRGLEPFGIVVGFHHEPRPAAGRRAN